MPPNDPPPLPDGLQQDVLADLPAPVVVLDAANRVVYANPAFETLTGYGCAELRAEPRPVLQDDQPASLQDALDDRRPFRGRVLARRRDGGTIRSLLSLAPVRSAPPAAPRFVGMLLDPTAAGPGDAVHGPGDGPRQPRDDLSRALGRGEIVAWFQPQYDARAGRLTGYEALARWHHPEHGVLPPDRFIPLAEADGLITAVGTEMLEQACGFADRTADGRPLQMQVNVSVEQLRVRGLADGIDRLLAGYPHRTWSLGVEITESALILDHALVLGELEQLRDLGVGISIDDFGSGYSSLSQLRDLPATELKIDRSFVHREDAVGTSLLTAIVALADSLDLLVVAEGIETPSQLARIRALDCDRLQGRYLCSALSPDEAPAARQDVAALLVATD